MATEVDWSKVDPNSKSSPGKPDGGSGKQKYLLWESGRTYRIRPVGHAVEFYKIFYNNKTFNIDVDDYSVASSKVAEAGLLDKWGKPLRLQFKFATNVIDRSDNQVKIMEAGTQIYKRFASWHHLNKAHPGSPKNGYDWAINVIGEGFDREYDAMHTTASPLTAEEKARLKKTGDDKEYYNLKEAYKCVPIDSLIETITNAPQAEPKTQSDELDGFSDEEPAF